MTDTIIETQNNNDLFDKIKTYAIFSAIFVVAALPIALYMMKDYVLILTHMYNYGGTFQENAKAYEAYKQQQKQNPPKKVVSQKIDPLTEYMLDDLMGDMPKLYVPHNDHE